MSAILKKNFSLTNAANMINIFGQVYPVSAPEQSLYLLVGRHEAWLDEGNPETPTNIIEDDLGYAPAFTPSTDTTVDSIRNNALFLKKVDPSNISLVIPRKDFAWSYSDYAGTESYSLTSLSKVSTTPYSNRDYYFKTSAGDVFLYLDVTYQPDSATIVEPLYTASIFTDTNGDKNIQYLYTINELNNPFLTDDWMPVTYNAHGYYAVGNSGTISATQDSHGDNNANFTLGVNHIMVSVTLAADFLYDYDFGLGTTPIEYRQVALLVNPRNINGDLLTGNSYGLTTNTADPNIVQPDGTIIYSDAIAPGGTDPLDADLTTGQIIYLENRVKVTRTNGQSETTKLVVEF